MEKPKCKLSGENGNIFNLLALAGKALKKAGLKEQAAEMGERAWASGSYDEALAIIQEYVDVS